MKTFAAFLRVIAAAFLLVGALHVVLGLNADAMLGAQIPAAVIADPGLDSQNRFFGASFALYGVLVWFCASNPTKYAAVLRCVVWAVFAGGLARLVSIALHGMPPPFILQLLLSELIAPPLVLWWFSHAQRQCPP